MVRCEFDEAVNEVRDSVRGCPQEVVAVAAKIVENWGTGRVPYELFNLRFNPEPSPPPEQPPARAQPRPQPRPPKRQRVEKEVPPAPPRKAQRSMLPVSINAPPARAQPTWPDEICLDDIFDPQPAAVPRFVPKPVQPREVTFTAEPLQVMGELCLNLDDIVEGRLSRPALEFQKVPHLLPPTEKRWLETKGRRHVPKHVQDKRASTLREYKAAVENLLCGNESCLTAADLFGGTLLGGDKAGSATLKRFAEALHPEPEVKVPKGRRNRKQSWSDTRVVRVEPLTQTDRPKPPRYWNGRRLHVVEFTDELLAPVPGRGERWAVSGPGDRLGAFLVEDVLEPTAVEQLLTSTKEYIISSGPVSALCAQARHLPAWKPTGNPAMPRACHTRNRLTVVLFKDAAVGDKIDLRQCEARGAFHVCDALTGKIVADSPVCLGEGDNPILAELSPCRDLMGWGIVKRTAALEPGLKVGSCICFEPAPTQAQLVARKRRLIAEAHAAAEKDVGRKPAPAAAVEHHLVRMGCGCIGATAAELRRCPATAAGVEPTALDIRWLAANNRHRGHRALPSPADRVAAVTAFLEGRGLLVCGGAAATWRRGFSCKAASIKPPTRICDSIGALVVDGISFPYATEARTTHVAVLKEKKGIPLSAIENLDQLVKAGVNADFRTITPAQADKLLAELFVRRKRVGSETAEKLETVAALKKKESSEDWHCGGSVRWSAVGALQEYVREQIRKSGSFGDRVRAFGETDGICTLRYTQLSRWAIDRLRDEARLLAGKTVEPPTPEYHNDPKLARITFWWDDLRESTTPSLDDGRVYTRGIPAVPVGDTVGLRGRMEGARLAPTEDQTRAADALVMALLAADGNPTVDPREVCSDPDTAIEVVEAARLVRLLGTGTSDDQEEAESCGRRRRWARSVCEHTLSPGVWDALRRAWRLGDAYV